MGVGSGSSIDFQDHRAYVPGDDPRYIDWQAYARSGHYTMKLYREEVSPRVDIVVDVSASMYLTPAKQRRTWELLYFAMESALQASASAACLAVSGQAWQGVPLESLLRDQWTGAVTSDGAAEGSPTLRPLPLRQGALRVLISDLMFPTPPPSVLLPLRSRNGRAVLLSPFDPAEEDPPWDGNVELVDCETGRSRRQRVDRDVRSRYRQAYRRHLDGWRREARRFDVDLARVSSEGRLVDSLRTDALRSGAVESRM
jgi:uncharacterized protein (DUF58 family)